MKYSYTTEESDNNSEDYSKCNLTPFTKSPDFHFCLNYGIKNFYNLLYPPYGFVKHSATFFVMGLYPSPFLSIFYFFLLLVYTPKK